MKYTRFGLAVAALALGSLGLLATTSPSAAEDLSYFEKGYAPFASPPVFVAPGPSFDAAACMKGKSILSIPVSSANPFTANIEKRRLKIDLDSAATHDILDLFKRVKVGTKVVVM